MRRVDGRGTTCQRPGPEVPSGHPNSIVPSPTVRPIPQESAGAPTKPRLDSGATAIAPRAALRDIFSSPASRQCHQLCCFWARGPGCRGALVGRAMHDSTSSSHGVFSLAANRTVIGDFSAFGFSSLFFGKLEPLVLFRKYSWQGYGLMILQLLTVCIWFERCNSLFLKLRMVLA